MSWVNCFQKLCKIFFRKYNSFFEFLNHLGNCNLKVYREFTATETEVPATWFGILNSLFIIILAPMFSKWWKVNITSIG